MRRDGDGEGERALCTGPWPGVTGGKVRFLHVPKCGSSFINSFLAHGCDELAGREDLVLGGPTPGPHTGASRVLQLECVAIECVRNPTQLSRT